MIKASFLYFDGNPKGFEVSGHADYAESGKDIVCAGVSSALMLTANMITESFGVKAQITDSGEKISLKLCEESKEAEKLIDAFKKHLELLSHEFNGRIIIENMEV